MNTRKWAALELFRLNWTGGQHESVAKEQHARKVRKRQTLFIAR
jgi:hypothetical protein